jgi:phospholipase C
MLSAKMFLLWGLLFGVALLLILNGCGGNGPSSLSQQQQSKIQHVVIIFQENRSTDNLFHDTNLMAKGADIASTALKSDGTTVPLTPSSLVTDYDLSHSHQAFVSMYDGGKMDGADQIEIHCNMKESDCPSPTAWFHYAEPSEVAPYFQLAETYVFGDRMFQTNQGPSFPAHQFIISGTSAPTPPGHPNSNYFESENMNYVPNSGSNPNAGCIALPGTTGAWIGPNGVEINSSPAQYPCFEHPTLTDLLNAKSITWRYYGPGAGSIWTAPNAIQHMCGPNVPPPNATACTGSDWVNGVVIPQTGVLTDISNNQLPAVSWVIPDGQESDHAGINDGSGPSWVASIVNAIGNSPYWSNTAIILTWDDWGGWYDHVAPPAIINSYEYGFRVPLVVISPYAKAGYISHTVYDFGSILKFIEATFGLSTVAPNASPAYADALTGTGDLSDCFNLDQTPLTFQTVQAPLDATHFLNDKRKPLDPDDD